MAGRRTALIVANDVYEHAGLRSLRSPGADATALADVLRDRRISDFDVRVVHNETTHVVLRHVEDLFADSRRDDVILLHFSCHGLKGESGELHFAMRDTRPDRLRSTAVAADYVQRCMAASRSRSIVLLLDCCYGGAYRQGVAVRASGDAHVLDNFSGGRGRAVITASSSMEYAFEGDHLADDLAPRPSVFTAAVVEGLATGAADRDEDGLIGLGELYDYVFERVRDRNPNQTPSRDVEMQGELFLARSGRKRIRPRPMPPDLLAATTDPNMFTRLGAIGELRTRLAHSDLQVAVGAHETLTRMAGNDISAVVDAATTALADAAITPVVHWGPDGTGTIRLSGPPLARACTFTSPQPWITLTEVDGGADVAVTGTAQETRHGTVVVQGPTGRVDVPVVAPATAPQPTTTSPKPTAPHTEHPEPGYATPATDTSVTPAAAAPGPAAPVSGTAPEQAGQPPAQPTSTSATDTKPTPGPTTPATRTTPDQAGQPPAQPTSTSATSTKPTPGPETPATRTTPDQATDTPTTETKPTPGPEPFAGTPDPPAGPADTPTPPGQIPTRSRAAVAAGGLAVVGALVLLRGLMLETSSDERFENSLPFALWYLIPVICLALVGGTVLLLAGDGSRNAAGFLVGVAITSAWGIPLLVTATVNGNVSEYYPGVWTALAGLALLFVAGVVAVVSTHREKAVRTVWHRPDRITGTALAVAVVGAFWLYYYSSLSVPSDRLFAFVVVPAVLAVVVLVWTTCLRPRRFALAVAIGWTAGGVFVGLSLWEAAIEMEVGWTGLLGFFAALLAAVTSAAVDPSDQPFTR